MSRRNSLFTPFRHARPSHRGGKLACVLLYALCLALYADDPAPTPRPAWPNEVTIGDATFPADHPERHTFVLPKRHAFCLVEVPSALPDGGYPERFAVRTGSSWLRSRLVRSDSETTLLLIDATAAIGGDIVEIYPVGRADTPPPPPPPPSSDATSPDYWGLRSPQPLACEFRRTRFPTETRDEEVLFGTHAAIIRRGNPERAMSAGIDQACERAAAAGQGRRRRQGDLLMDLRTMLLVEESGTYLFAVKCPGAAAVHFGRDDEPVARSFHPFPTSFQPDEPRTLPAEWTLGREIELEQGVWPLHIAALIPAGSDPALAVGWLRPGAKDIEPLPSSLFLSGQSDLPAVRTERRDATLLVSFRTRLSAPYRFASTNATFSLLTAAPRCDLWVPADDEPAPTQQWFVDGVPLDTATAWRATLATPLSPGSHEIVLHCTFRDHTAAATQTVSVAGAPGQEYRIAAAPNGVLPILREDDILRPDLWITGDSVGVDAELVVRLRNGESRTVRSSVTPELQWARLQAPELPVSEAAGLSWSVRHAGVVLDQGVLDLVRPPFRDLPTDITGMTLHAANGHLVSFVAPREREEAPIPDAPSPLSSLTSRLSPPTSRLSPSTSPLPPPLVLLDDLLTTASVSNSAFQLSAALGGDVLHLRFPALRRDDGEGLSTIAPLCGLDAVPQGADVVVAIALEDWLGRRTPEEYERSLAVVARLLRDARGARVIVCTPPPFHGDTAALRPYAAAALRAAASCGVGAADLFSGFLNAPAHTPLVEGIRLTDAGVRRAGEIVRRQLRHDAPPPSTDLPPSP